MANRYVRAAGGNYSAAGTWEETAGGGESVAAPTASDDVFLAAGSGQLTIDAAAAAKSVTCTGYTGTLTHNAFVWTISGSATFVSGMTYTPLATSTITIAANSTFTTGGKLMPLMILNTGITVTLGDNLSFMASKVITLTLNGNSLALNGFTVSGNSSVNRILIRSNTLGTARTITNTTGTFANADFRDITLSAAADLSAITGLSGDCGGNTNITFTTAATQTYTGATDNWSTAAKWTSRVPLPQDNVSMSGVTGGGITADMPRLGKSIDWTGAAGTPALSLGTGITLYGSLTYISAMTIAGGQTTTFEGRGSYTITMNGKAFSSSIIVAAIGGTYDMRDDLSIAGNSFTLSNGTFNTNGFAMTIGNLFNISNSNTRAFNITNSTLTTSATSGTPWALATTTGITLTTTGSTIVFSDTGGSSKTFAGGGLTYNNFLISGGGAGAVIITGANTFNRIYTNGGGTKSITLPGSTTTTLLSGQGLGNGTNVITFTASAGSATIANSSAEFLSWDYVNLTNILAIGTASFYAGANSTDGGGNTGWSFVSGTSELSDIGTGLKLPRGTTLHNICMWLDGAGHTLADRVTKTAYTNLSSHQDVIIHDGKSITFDGVASKITCGDRSISNTKTVKTALFWANPADVDAYFVDLNGTASVGMTDNEITTAGWTSPTVYVNGVATSTVTSDVWSLIAVTSATGIDASAVVLGKIGSDYYEGAMTNIILLDKVLTATDVGWIYNRSK